MKMRSNSNIEKKSSVEKQIELAEAINLTGGKQYPEQFREIITQYAEGLITYDYALRLIKQAFRNDKN